MLLRFRVANFRSIRDEAVLSLVDVPRRGDGGAQRSAVPRTLRVAGIYGANASGKSNVLLALNWMIDAIIQSQTRWSPTGGVPGREPFSLDDESSTRPSFFELDFVHDGVRYTYGFEVDDAEIRGEWLHGYPTGRERMLFERIAADQIRFGRSLTGELQQIKLLTRRNSLYLSSAASNDHPLLSRLFRQLTLKIKIATQSEGDLTNRIGYTTGLLRDPDHKQYVVRLLREADLGVVGLRSSFRARTDVPGDLGRAADDTDPPGDLSVESFELLHESQRGMHALGMEKESAGTQAWLGLLGPILTTLERGDVLLIDEVDSSLHPYLSSTVIRLFKDPEVNSRGAQLIFASHDTTLMGTLLDEQLLDRAEVWLTRKSPEGATELYSLAEFHPRKGENFERGYLQGRYGAVPYVDYEGIRQLFLARQAEKLESTTR